MCWLLKSDTRILYRISDLDLAADRFPLSPWPPLEQPRVLEPRAGLPLETIRAAREEDEEEVYELSSATVQRRWRAFERWLLPSSAKDDDERPEAQ
jgi:hypothetical protein